MVKAWVLRETYSQEQKRYTQKYSYKSRRDILKNSYKKWESKDSSV